MISVVFDKSAEQDLENILHYLLEETHGSKAAEKLLTSLYNKAKALKEFPELYPVYKPARDMNHIYRFYPIYGYLVFYYQDQDLIHINRIIHTKRNITEYLK